jgi:hypothetical protein
MDRYKCTLDEAQKRIRAAPINPLDQSNRILVRELNWIAAALKCDDYPSRQFRECINTILRIQRAGQLFYYGATERRVAFLQWNPADPRVIRWHDGANGKNYINEHAIDLKTVFMAMRSRPSHEGLSDIYHYIARMIFFVSAATSERLRGKKMPEWDGDELFVRFRKLQFTHLYLFPGYLDKVGTDWKVQIAHF